MDGKLRLEGAENWWLEGCIRRVVDESLWHEGAGRGMALGWSGWWWKGSGVRRVMFGR